MRIKYLGQAIDEDTGVLLKQISAYSMTDFEEDLGKLEAFADDKEPRPCRVDKCDEPYVPARSDEVEFYLCADHYHEYWADQASKWGEDQRILEQDV